MPQKKNTNINEIKERLLGDIKNNKIKERDEFILYLKQIYNDSYVKEFKLYNLMGKRHPLSDKIEKNEDKSINESVFLDWLSFSETITFVEIIKYMSSKEYINNLYMDANKKQKYQVRVRTANQGDSWVDRTYKQFLNDEEITKDINKIKDNIEIYLINLATSESIVLANKKEDIKRLIDKLEETIMERIEKNSKDNISIEYIGGSVYQISDESNVDAFKNIRENSSGDKKSDVIKKILEILYNALSPKFSNTYINLFKEKTESNLKYFLGESVGDGDSISTGIKKLFPKNQQGIQGTLGEQFFASIISNRIEKEKVMVMGQSLNALGQQAHIDVKIVIGNEIIGVQNKQYNSILNIENQIYFYKQEYNIYGKSLIRYLSDENGEEENAENIVKYLRCLAIYAEEGYIYLDDEIIQILLPYFQNFSRISDPKAIKDLKNQKNNFFVYNFRLVPLSFIIWQLIKQIQNFNSRKKIESIGRDIFSLTKKYKGYGIPYDDKNYIPNSKNKVKNGVFLKFSGLPLKLGGKNLVKN